MPENQRIVLTKRLLKEALLRLLKKKRIEKVNISELCQEAGINRATFYRHYELPIDVLHDIERDILHDMQILETEPKSIQDIAKEYEKICTYLYSHAELTKILLINNSQNDFACFTDFYLEKFLSTTFAKHLDRDSTRLLLSGITGGSHALLRTWFLEDINKTPKEMTNLLVQMLEKGKYLFSS